MRWTISFAYAHRLRFSKANNEKEPAECTCGEWKWPDLLEPYVPVRGSRNRKPKLESSDVVEKRAQWQAIRQQVFSAWDAHMESRPEAEKCWIAEAGEPDFS